MHTSPLTPTGDEQRPSHGQSKAALMAVASILLVYAAVEWTSIFDRGDSDSGPWRPPQGSSPAATVGATSVPPPVEGALATGTISSPAEHTAAPAVPVVVAVPTEKAVAASASQAKIEACLALLRPCALSWAQSLTVTTSVGFTPNACGFGGSDLRDRSRRALEVHVFRFHGDSTLRHVLKTTLRFLGINGNLEKRDANKTERGARFFSEPGVMLMFRFDFVADQLMEPVVGEPAAFASHPRVDVLAFGLHMGSMRLVEQHQSIDTALAAIPAEVGPALERYLTAVNGDDRVTAVVMVLQELDCAQIAHAPIQQFRDRAKYCPDILRFVVAHNAFLVDLVKSQPELTRKVVLVGPMDCVKLCRGGRCSCTKDGIHLRGTPLKKATEAVLHVVAKAAACRSVPSSS